MKVAGFTIVRNGVKYGYPFVESIQSLLPLVDQLYVGLGNSEDETEKRILEINSDKIKLIHSVWDDSKRKGGEILAIETNKIFDAIPEEYDWCFYLQADEVLHEQYYPDIKNNMRKYLGNKNVQGLLFKYIHFFGTYHFIGDSRSWYRNEVRIVRNDKSIRSYKDAQGFRINSHKLRVKPIDAFVYHYGWVKDPRTMQEKQKDFNKYWHDDQWIQENVGDADDFDYSSVDSVAKFQGTHPKVMASLIESMNWNVNLDPSKTSMNMKQKILMKIEKATGLRLFEYKNFKVV